MKRRAFLIDASIAAVSSLAKSRAFRTESHAALQLQPSVAQTSNLVRNAPSDYHGFSIQTFDVEGCSCFLVSPREPLAGRPWIWRTMFWDAFPAVDLALLDIGFHLGFIDVGNTFGAPEPMKHFDAFHSTVTRRFGLAYKAVLEGLSRGGLCAYRWASSNASIAVDAAASSPNWTTGVEFFKPRG